MKTVCIAINVIMVGCVFMVWRNYQELKTVQQKKTKRGNFGFPLVDVLFDVESTPKEHRKRQKQTAALLAAAMLLCYVSRVIYSTYF